MSFYNDSPFLFVSETDLLPVWCNNEPSYSSDFAENIWEDTFSPSEYSDEGVTIFPKIEDTYVHDQNINETEDIHHDGVHHDGVHHDGVHHDGFHEYPPPITHVHSVVWDKPSVPAEDLLDNRTPVVTFFPVDTQFVVNQQQQQQQQKNELYSFSVTTEESNFEQDAYVSRPSDMMTKHYLYDDKVPEERSHPYVKAEEPEFGSDLLEEISGDPSDFKLPASKSPIMEAMVVCAIKNWGISIHRSSPNQVVFRVSDFDRYYKISRSICSKQHPTEDIGSRVKSLRRWFDNFPKKKDRQDNPDFLLAVKSSGTKKVNEMIERNTRLMGVQKRRRRQ